MFIRDTWVRIDLRNKIMELFGVELRGVHRTALEPDWQKKIENKETLEKEHDKACTYS
jgi:hypothetical protein